MNFQIRRIIAPLAALLTAYTALGAGQAGYADLVRRVAPSVVTVIVVAITGSDES